MALTAVSINDTDAPIPYMLPFAAPASVAVTTAAAGGFTFTNTRAGQPYGDQTPLWVAIKGDAAWAWCQADQAGGFPMVANESMKFAVGTQPVTIYCRSVTGTANLYAAVIAKSNPPSTFA